VLQNSAEMYSAADYVEMLIIFGECGRNAREAARIFSDRFPDRPSPDHKTILRVLARAQETRKVLPNRNEIAGGARTARTLANEEAILNIVEEDGTKSIREIAQEVDISSRSVHRVLNQNRLHPFYYTRVQRLEPEDYPARRNVCVWLLNKAAEDENFISRILFSDESSFGRQGCFNHRNLHVWSYDNPRATYPRAFQRRFSVNLWSGLVGDSVVSQDCKK
jgi:AraC-like DNA-binding protein